MKKLFTLTSGAVLLFSLTACSPREPSEQQSQSQQEQVTIARGTYNEDRTVYTNDSTGMRIELPEGWYVYSDEEVAVALLPSVTGDELAEWGEEEFKREKVIPDTIILDPNTNNYLLIQYENLTAENATDITDELYMENIKSQLDKSEYDYTYEEIDNLTLSGKNYEALKGITNMYGRTVEKLMMYARHGDYMICMIYTSFDGSGTDRILDCFK